MSDYSSLAKQLAAVRRAWKRTAALSGLAVTCLETLGVLTVAFLIDWIYQPLPAWRFILFIGVLVAVAALLLRHVVRPILRRISDDQVALFIEEHNERFEGSLITATEYGGPSAKSTAPGPFVDAVIRSAVQRAKTINLRTILDLRRLRKYGVAALAVLAGYGVLALAVPDVTRHAGRVLAPWQKRAEDLQALDRATLMKMPITFKLSKGDTSQLRGAAFELEAVLSRRSDEPVTLNFRPAGDTKGNWRVVPMQEIDKLNGFKGALADVTEDMAFCVAAGSHRSGTFKISVYDPLVVQSVELRTKYPAYLQLPDKVEVYTDNTAADVAAPETSKVQLRIAANRPLQAGWVTVTPAEGGATQRVPLAPDPQGKGAASCTLEVKQDGTYEYEVDDAIGQKVVSSAHGYIRVLQDGPPTMEVRHPITLKAPVPKGEVTFQAALEDDLALSGVDVIYERQFPNASPEPGVPVKTQSGRLALELKNATLGSFPETAEASGRLLLEKLDPPAQPEEIISYYLECRDRKGQKVVSEIQTIAVQHYDNWIAANTKPPHEPTFTIMKDIEEYVKMTWALHQAREKLAKADVTKGCQALAESMLDDSKRMYAFYNPKKIPSDKKFHARKADEYILSGHDALTVEDTGKAVADFRVAAAELKICGISDRAEMEMFTADFGKPGNQKEKDLRKLFEKITMEVPKVEIPKAYLDKMKAAEELKRAAAELEKKQAEIAQKADQLAKKDDRPDAAQMPRKDANAKDQNAANQDKQGQDKQGPDKQGADKQNADKKNGAGKDQDAKNQDKKDGKDAKANAGDANKKDGDKTQDQNAKALASQQDNVADETRREAAKAKGDLTAEPTARQMAGRMEDAAREMKDATRNLRDGKLDEAAAAAERARKELMQVATGAEQLRQEKLAEAIAQAEKEAGRILNRQRELTAQTQTAAQKPADQQDKDFKRLAFQQAQLKSGVEAVKETIKDLNTFAQKDAKPETAKQIEESHRQMNRGQVEQKMANAVVELTGQQGAPAVKEQKAAEGLLTTVVDNLRKAADTLASDTEAELRRAAAEAAQIDDGLKKLGVKEPEAKPADQTPGKPATPPPTQIASNDTKQQSPKKDAKTPGEPTDPTKKPAAQPPSATADNKTGDKTGSKTDVKTDSRTDKKPDGKTDDKTDDKTGEKTDDKTVQKPLSDQEKKDLAENLTYDMERFAAHLENRQFVDKKDSDALKKHTQDPGGLAKTLKEDNAKREELGLLVRRVRNKLETEYKAQLDSKRLVAAQREECPPAYRSLVNKYYEALSQERR